MAVPIRTAGSPGAGPPADPDGPLGDRILAAIREVEDFPRVGVRFRDLGGVWATPALLADLTAAAAAAWRGRVDSVVGVDARGFLLGATVAQALRLPLVLARKPGKVPGPLRTVSYDLEYGSAGLAVRVEDEPLLQAPLVVDDLLATGGTLAAVDRLITGAGGAVVGFAVAVELAGLGGAAVLGRDRVWSACRIADPAPAAALEVLR